MNITLDDVIEMLEDIQEDVDYEECVTLIDDGVLDSSPRGAIIIIK